MGSESIDGWLTVDESHTLRSIESDPIAPLRSIESDPIAPVMAIVFTVLVTLVLSIAIVAGVYRHAWLAGLDAALSWPHHRPLRRKTLPEPARNQSQ